MSVYVNPSDCTDPALSAAVTATHCAQADTRVETDLWGKGINPGDLTLPMASLTLLGACYAQSAAALEKASGEQSTMMEKHLAYEAKAKALAKSITPQSLGLDVTSGAGGGMGSIEIGRG